MHAGWRLAPLPPLGATVGAEVEDGGAAGRQPAAGAPRPLQGGSPGGGGSAVVGADGGGRWGGSGALARGQQRQQGAGEGADEAEDEEVLWAPSRVLATAFAAGALAGATAGPAGAEARGAGTGGGGNPARGPVRAARRTAGGEPAPQREGLPPEGELGRPQTHPAAAAVPGSRPAHIAGSAGGEGATTGAAAAGPQLLRATQRHVAFAGDGGGGAGVRGSGGDGPRQRAAAAGPGLTPLPPPPLQHQPQQQQQQQEQRRRGFEAGGEAGGEQAPGAKRARKVTFDASARQPSPSPPPEAVGRGADVPRAGARPPLRSPSPPLPPPPLQAARPAAGAASRVPLFDPIQRPQAQGQQRPPQPRWQQQQARQQTLSVPGRGPAIPGSADPALAPLGKPPGGGGGGSLLARVSRHGTGSGGSRGNGSSGLPSGGSGGGGGGGGGGAPRSLANPWAGADPAGPSAAPAPGLSAPPPGGGGPCADAPRADAGCSGRGLQAVDLFEGDPYLRRQ